MKDDTSHLFEQKTSISKLLSVQTKVFIGCFLKIPAEITDHVSRDTIRIIDTDPSQKNLEPTKINVLI